MHSTLKDWLNYLETLHPQAIALGLERVAQVAQHLKFIIDFPLITVGGTNGKGSVCAMLLSTLQAAGYRVGCYTSPHLLSYNERVVINKILADDAMLCAAFEKIEQARENISLTYFEFGTLAAMLCFIEQKVDVAILEVGLGGRLDAVNLFDSDCAIITSIDIDHTDYLGDTREKIAFEKAGIFRKGKFAIFGDRDMPISITNEACRIGAKLCQLGKEFDYTENKFSPMENHSVIRLTEQTRMDSSSPLFREKHNPKQWNFRGLKGERNALPYPVLFGKYQLNNASAALAALDVLKEQLPISMEAVRRGMSEVSLPGRFQILPGTPQWILDVAHNPHAAHSLAQNLAEFPKAYTYAVFAMLKDKNIRGVIRELKSQVDVWLVANIEVSRGASASHLAQLLKDEGITQTVLQFASTEIALEHVCIQASENDRIVVFGSFYTVAEAMRVRNLRHVQVLRDA